MSGPVMTFDNAFKIVNVLAWALAVVVFYFSGQADTAGDIARASERISVIDQKIQQEVIGYQVLQSSIGERLNRIERKVDCLIDKRLCH